MNNVAKQAASAADGAGADGASQVGPVSDIAPGPLSFGERVAAAKRAGDLFEEAKTELACAAAYHSENVEFVDACRQRYLDLRAKWSALVDAMGRAGE